MPVTGDDARAALDLLIIDPGDAAQNRTTFTELMARLATKQEGRRILIGSHGKASESDHGTEVAAAFLGLEDELQNPLVKQIVLTDLAVLIDFAEAARTLLNTISSEDP